MRRVAGLSLAEIIVAASLISLSLFFLISIIPTANFSLHKAQDLETMNTYGQEVLEYTKQALPAQTPLPTATPVTTQSQVSLNNMDFVLQTTINPLESQPTLTDMYYLYEIDVVLYRKDGKGSPVQKVTRLMVKAPKACPSCCCPNAVNCCPP